MAHIINFIFSYLGNFQSKVFILYFSYHKPIVSFLSAIQMTMSQSKIYQSNLCTIIIIYCLVGLVVSMSDYWSWGRGFDPRHFHKF